MIQGYEPQSRAGRLVAKVFIFGIAITMAVGICWAVLFGPKEETEAQHKINEQKVHGQTRDNGRLGNERTR